MNWHTKQDAFKVLVSTVLSQRTRDEKTDEAAKQLFAKYPDAKSLSKAPVKSIEKLIRPAGFYRMKAPRIRFIAREILDRFDGKVPADIELLLSLPGVGRKTANCVMVYGHGISAIPVDTHVHRISNRLGIVKTKTPDDTELALTRVLPKKHWLLFNQLLVIHGQNICRPVSPQCAKCPADKYCDYYKLVYTKEKIKNMGKTTKTRKTKTM